MNVKNSDLQANYNAQFTSTEKTSDINYDVVDDKDRSLISYNLNYYLVINPYIFTRNNSDTNARQLTALNYILKNYNNKYDLTKIDINNKSEKLYWKIDEALYNNLKRFKDVNGIYEYCTKEVDRSKAANIYNIITNPKDKNNKKFKKEDSLEKNIYNKFSDSSYPKIAFKSDSNGNLISSELVNSKISKVKLTIDKDMNDKVQDILDNSSLKQVGAIVMESDNGAIRALTQKNQYDANINLGYSGIYYPGSIFKAVVEEAALESNSISLHEKIKNTGEFSQEKIYDYCTPEEAFIVSSNDVFINIGQRTGFDNIYNAAKAQGLFGTVLNLDGESKGVMDSMDSNNVGNLSLLSYGQSLRITPIEAISIPNTVIDKGIYVKPHIVDSYVDASTGKIENENVEQKRVISESTADIMRGQFEKVLTDKNGTGHLAYTPNPCIGGKTGTAQRGQDKNKKIQHDDGWFIGFFNLKGVNYSAVIFAPDILNDESAGSTTAPIFKSIVEQLSK